MADEYTPTHDAERGMGGRGDAYGRMLVEELKPFVDPDANIAAYLGCGRAREGALPRSEGAR